MLPIATSTFTAYATSSIGPAIEGFMFMVSTNLPYFLVLVFIITFLVIIMRLMGFGK